MGDNSAFLTMVRNINDKDILAVVSPSHDDRASRASRLNKLAPVGHPTSHLIPGTRTDVSLADCHSHGQVAMFRHLVPNTRNVVGMKITSLKSYYYFELLSNLILSRNLFDER